MTSKLYAQDYYAWTKEQAAKLRAGRVAEIDLEDLAEEIESMGRSEWYELVNRLAVLLAHLLKWRCQPSRRSNSWRLTIKEQRRRVLLRLKKSPSLQHELEETLGDAYESAVLKAAREMKVDESTLPAHCPFTVKQVLDNDYWPD
jgi:hypothetical protein